MRGHLSYIDASDDGEGTSMTTMARGYLALNFIVTADLVYYVFDLAFGHCGPALSFLFPPLSYRFLSARFFFVCNC